MSAFQALSPRPPASLETVHNILASLVSRYRQEEVLTTIRQLPVREAKFRPVPAWVTSALAEAYRDKGIRELYSHQAITAELVHDGKNVVVVTPTASGKTLCYNLPVLNAVLENSDTCPGDLFSVFGVPVAYAHWRSGLRKVPLQSKRLKELPVYLLLGAITLATLLRPRGAKRVEYDGIPYS